MGKRSWQHNQARAAYISITGSEYADEARFLTLIMMGVPHGKLSVDWRRVGDSPIPSLTDFRTARATFEFLEGRGLIEAEKEDENGFTTYHFRGMGEGEE